MENQATNDNCSYTVEQLIETLQEEIQLLRMVMLTHYISDADIIEAQRLFCRKTS